MVVLVTGVNGLVGLHCARILLEKGCGVVGYDSNLSGELAYYPEVSQNLSFIRGNLTDFSHLLETVEKHRVEHVLHLASLRDERLYSKAPAELFRANIEGTQNILELGRLGKVKRVVFASSASVYGKQDDPYRPIPEDSVLDPRGIYANSKAMCESLCRAYRNVYGVEVFVLRPSRVYGRLANLDTLEFGNPLSSFVLKALRGEPIREKSGADFGGDFTYAPDVAYGFYCALTAPSPRNWVYNISSGEFYRLSEVARILSSLFKRLDISLGPGMEPHVSQSPIRGPLDIRSARQEINFEIRYDLKGSIEHFVQTIRQRVPDIGKGAYSSP
jgi:nucleoside-diphosphate-sugar epimerase